MRGTALAASHATEEAQLEQVYSRGLGPYFLTGTNHQTVVKGRSPRHRGVLCGRVVRARERRLSSIDPDAWIGIEAGRRSRLRRRRLAQSTGTGRGRPHLRSERHRRQWPGGIALRQRRVNPSAFAPAICSGARTTRPSPRCCARCLPTSPRCIATPSHALIGL